MQKNFRIKKLFIGIFIILVVNSFMFSEKITKRIGIYFFSLDTDSKKVDVSLSHNVIYRGNAINDEVIAAVIRNEKTYDYEYIIYNCKTGIVIDRYLLNKENYKEYKRKEFYTYNNIYSIVKNRIEKLSIDGTVLMSKIIEDPKFFDTINYFMVDEQNDVAICEFLDKKNKSRIVIYSLTDEFESKEYYGKLLFKMTRETNKLYYSDSKTIYCVDYNKNFDTTKIKAEKKIGEQIFELVQFDNSFIMVTKKNYFESFTTNIIFGAEAFRNYYYLCSLEDDKLIIQEKVFTNEIGETFWY